MKRHRKQLQHRPMDATMLTRLRIAVGIVLRALATQAVKSAACEGAITLDRPSVGSGFVNPIMVDRK